MDIGSNQSVEQQATDVNSPVDANIGHMSTQPNSYPSPAQIQIQVQQAQAPQQRIEEPQHSQQQVQQQQNQQPLQSPQLIPQPQLLMELSQLQLLPQQPIEQSQQAQQPSQQPIGPTQQPQQPPPSPSHKTTVTKVKLIDSVDLFDWFKGDILNHIAEKARNSVDQIITVLDPGMKEYLYSGGNINILVISQTQEQIPPIRDAFQNVFGRATVIAARYEPPEAANDNPVKLANSFESAICIAKERIAKLRADTNKIPQNQVVIALQPTIVCLDYSNFKDACNLSPKRFLTYCLILEDPVLSLTIHSYSQFIPIDEGSEDSLLKSKLENGFSKSMDELMAEKLNSKPAEAEADDWLNNWIGLSETELIHNLSMTIGNNYKRKWKDYIG